MRPSLCLYAFSTVVSAGHASDPAYAILADGSEVRGSVSERGAVRMFLGIPYAEPVQRWRDPEPKKAWPGQLDATHYGANCMQDVSSGPPWPSMAGANYSEDCLFLNVYAPSLPPDEYLPPNGKSVSYPVVVFIHGGGYSYGGSHDSELNGFDIANLADVIVVVINYRVDIFGWLATKHFQTDGSAAVGNWGLKDQRLAMQWVKNNARAFGGNSDEIMIFGESAGAASVSCHVASQKSWGLFSRAAMQSGGFQNWASKTLPAAEANYEAFTKAMGCAAGDVGCLRAKTHEELLNFSQSAPLPHLDSWDSCRWSPVIDGVELQGHPAQELHSGRVAPVPLLLGTNKDEGVSFSGYGHSGPDPHPPAYGMDSTAFADWVTRNFGSTALPKVQELYSVPEKYSTYYQAAEVLIGDYMMTCPNRRFARWHEVHSPNITYVYNFAETPGHDAEHWNTGVFHGAEIRFVFFDGLELDNWDEKALAESMVRYWTNFASSGDPNSRLGPEGHRSVQKVWPPFEHNQSYMLLQLPEVQAKVHQKDPECDYWDTMAYPFHTSGTFDVLV